LSTKVQEEKKNEILIFQTTNYVLQKKKKIIGIFLLTSFKGMNEKQEWMTDLGKRSGVSSIEKQREVPDSW
jgi:hypothetical protein